MAIIYKDGCSIYIDLKWIMHQSIIIVKKEDCLTKPWGDKKYN